MPICPKCKKQELKPGEDLCPHCKNKLSNFLVKTGQTLITLAVTAIAVILSGKKA